MSDPRPKIRLVLSPEAERYVRRDGPVEVRRMAARGALPFPPVELATVLFALLHDPDAETKERARQSLEALPESVTVSVLAGAAQEAQDRARGPAETNIARASPRNAQAVV